MAEDIENESIRISELPETTSVDKSNDCLVISKTSDIYSTGSKSYKITPQNLLSGVGVDYTAGDNITISEDNVISATIPTASSSDLGGVKVGSGLSIDSEGVLSATGGGGGASSFSDLDDVSINEHTLANGQVPVYNSATQKWENMNQSGGGSGHTILDDEGTSLPQRDDLQFKGAYSEDDSTNEKTVVNVVREMTKAEFDELTEAEKTGFINITDITGGNDDRFQPVIFSEEEREIGVWKNGKPLYQKTVVLSDTDIKDGAYQKYFDLSVDNLEEIAKFEPTLISTTNDAYPLPYVNLISGNGSIYVGYFFDVPTTTYQRVQLRYGGGITSNYFGGAIVTFQYTKTTDQAGSGQWTPQGVPAVHYSTDEQIVGTWIDGNTLYEKTLVMPNAVTVTANGAWVDSGVSAPSGSTVIKADIVNLYATGVIGIYVSASSANELYLSNIPKTADITIPANTPITIRYTKSRT